MDFHSEIYHKSTDYWQYMSASGATKTLPKGLSGLKAHRRSMEETVGVTKSVRTVLDIRRL